MAIPAIPVIEAKIIASITDILPCGNGRFCVLVIKPSKLRSIIWLNPFEEPVTKKPPITNQPKLA